MLKVYDKAQWHIDAGEDESAVVKKWRFYLIF